MTHETKIKIDTNSFLKRNYNEKKCTQYSIYFICFSQKWNKFIKNCTSNANFFIFNRKKENSF